MDDLALIERYADVAVKVGLNFQKGQRLIIEAAIEARRLGELAIVPENSPVAQSGVLFYHTLFDENASCHFALGSTHRAQKNAFDMSDQGFHESGANDSRIHVDFMIGSSTLNIDGISESGKQGPILKKGEWTI